MGQGDDMVDKKDNEDKVLTILLTRGPYISEYADLAVNLALKARKKGYKVNMFCYLDGAWLPHLKTDKDYSNPGEWLKWAMKKGVNVRACERCSSARDIPEDDVQEGVKISGIYSFIDMLAESDKVLTFTG
jgi:tRNA 2-thiouridine synthesizing protein D